MNRVILRVLLLSLGVISAGCGMSNSDVSARPITTVDPLNESEFDGFAARIAERLSPLGGSQRGQSVAVGAPEIVVEEEGWRPSARYFSYSLMDGVSDRTAGAVRFSRGGEPAEYKSMLLFSSSKAGNGRRAVEFVVTDRSGSREVLREVAESSRMSERQPVSKAPPPPTQEPVLAIAPNEPEREAIRESAPKKIESTRRRPPEPQREPDAHVAVEPPSEPRAETAKTVKTEEGPQRVRTKEIKIDAEARELGAQIIANAARYASGTFIAPGGRVILLDNDSVEAFGVSTRPTARTPRGNLQTQLTLIAKAGSTDVEYRVVFFDEDDRPVSATPVLTAEFRSGESKRFTVTASDKRAARYVWLVRED